MSTMLFRLLLLQIVCLSFALAMVNETNPQIITITTKTITLPAGYIYYPNIQTAYKVHSEKLGWRDAKARCISEGGHLAVIDTSARLRYVKAQKSRNHSVWVGISKKNTKWVAADTGSRLSDLPWGSNQPSGVGTCASVQKNGKGLYNRLCVWMQPFVCEIPIATTVYAVPCHCD